MLVTVQYLCSCGQKSIPNRLCDGIIDTAGTQKEEKVMKETWNVLDPDEYVKHNPFMGYTNMKIEKISPECSEISMKITHGVTNLMGMVHGGMLYACLLYTSKRYVRYRSSYSRLRLPDKTSC